MSYEENTKHFKKRKKHILVGTMVGTLLLLNLTLGLYIEQGLNPEWIKILAVLYSGVTGHILFYLLFTEVEEDAEAALGETETERQNGKIGKYNREHIVTRWFPDYLGIIEGMLFAIVLFVEKPEFIVFWVGLKTAGEWAGWKNPIVGRIRFIKFLIGTGLSLLIAGVIYYGTNWIISKT